LELSYIGTILFIKVFFHYILDKLITSLIPFGWN